jgi:hypothetical protein
MKSSLDLKDPRWNDAGRRAAIAAALAFSAAELVTRIKEADAASVPRGRTYRIGSIRRAASKRNDVQGLRTRTTAAGNLQRVVGSTFYRASAPGQRPAIKSGRLINSIRAEQIGAFKYRVGSSLYYAVVLDDPNRLNRPFFKIEADAYRPRFTENIGVAWTTGKFEG